MAGYHAHHGISLDRDDRNYHIDKTSPATYQQQNIHQPVGEFEMPMGFEQMKAFETLNDVAINVIGYDKGQLNPLRVSSFESVFLWVSEIQIWLSHLSGLFLAVSCWTGKL